MHSDIQSNDPAVAASSSSVALCLLADDLTGACDAGAAFAVRGFATEVGLQADALPQPGTEVWIRNSGTRDVPVQTLAAALQRELKAMPPARMFFKKIDSVFRGNTFAEIAWTAHAFAGRSVMIAPAFPANGRTMKHGELYVHGVDELNVAGELCRHGLSVRHLPAGAAPEIVRSELRHALQCGEVVLADATSEEHLEGLTRALRDRADEVIWVGSGGLAAALAASLGRDAHASESEGAHGEVVFFIGSTHPVTLSQVVHLGACLQPGIGTLASIGFDDTDATRIADALRSKTPGAVSCFVLSGGDTAALVCRQLGIQALKLRHEFAPGVPVADAVGGSWQGVLVVLKSGGFGDADLFSRLLAEYGNRKHLCEPDAAAVGGVGV